MPSRRSHTKSRRGCLQCKRRHVKCDEDLPRCGLCKKRKLDCSYPPVSGDSDGQPPTTPQDGLEPLIPSSSSSESPWSTRILEFRLFHHYLTETYLTLLQANLDTNHFQKVVPKLAMSHPFLLDSLLALSALHLASSDTADKPMWLEAALKYQNRACSAFSRALAEGAEEEIGPAFICSIFIMLCATAYPVISQDGQAYVFEPLAQVLEVRRLMTGCALLFAQLQDFSRHGELKGWLRYKNEGLNEDHNVEVQPVERAPEKIQLRDDLSYSLRGLQEKINKIDTPQQEVYRTACGSLQEATRRWPLGNPNGGFIAFPVNISEDFIFLLKDGDWMARILFLHYGVGMHLLCDKWFVGEWGRRMVYAVLEPLDSVPAEWAETVLWTRKAVGLD